MANNRQDAPLTPEEIEQAALLDIGETSEFQPTGGISEEEARQAAILPFEEETKTTIPVIEQIEKYVQAPTRAALLPLAAKGLKGALEVPGAFAEQFGEEPGIAPTMREIAQVAGVPETKLPIPELEPGLGVSIPTETLQRLARVPEEMRTPTEAPASEVAASAMEQLIDPTAALILGAAPALKTTAAALPLAGAGLRATARGAGQLTEKAGEFAGKQVGGLIGGLKSLSEIQQGKIKGGQIGLAIAKGITELPESTAQIVKNLTPSIQPKFFKFYSLAQRTGINPDLITENVGLLFGKDAFMTKVKKAQGAVNLNLQIENFDQLNREISTALDTEIGKISKGKALNDRVATGQQIIQAYDNAVDDLFKEAEVRYSNATKMAPETAFTPDKQLKLVDALAEIEKEQNNLIQFSVDKNVRSQAKQDIDAINRIISNVANNDINVAIKQMQELGRAAFSSDPPILGGKIAVSKGTTKKLYYELKNVIDEAFKESNEKVYNELMNSNEIQKNFFNRSKFIADTIKDSKLAPEKVYERLVLNADSKRLEALDSIIGGSDAWDAAKGQYLFDLLKRNADDIVPYNQLRKKLKDQKNVRNFSLLFNKGETNTFEELLQLGSELGGRDINPSGTAWATKMFEMVTAPIAEMSVKPGITKGVMGYFEQRAYQDYFKDMPISQILDIRKRNILDPQMMDNIIQLKMAEPQFAQALKSAKQTGAITYEMAKDLESKMESITPVNNWTVFKEYLSDAGTTFGVGLIPAMSPLERSTKLLQTISRVQKEKYGESNVPVLIPEEDRESVRYALQESNMNSIQKAKNLRSLNTTGYILDLKGLTPEDEQSTVMKRLIQKNVFKPEAPKEFKEDRPDVLKQMIKGK